MLVFLDESFRTNPNTGRDFGVLAGVAIPEGSFHDFQLAFFKCRHPYHGVVLNEDDEIKGKELLSNATLKRRQLRGASQHWDLAEKLLQLTSDKAITTFGVVCFRPHMKSFVCGDVSAMDVTFRYLFERIENYMKKEYPNEKAKLIFDNRDHRTHETNAKAITNFFVKSHVGRTFDTIIRIPLFAVSQGHNYGLQLADLVTTSVALRFQGRREFDPMWDIVKSTLYTITLGGKAQTSLKVMRETSGVSW